MEERGSGRVRKVLNGSAKRPKVTKVRAHPIRLEAMTLLKGGSVARWALTDPPQILAQIRTGFSEIVDMVISSDGTLVVLTGAPRNDEPYVEFRSWDDLALVQRMEETLVCVSLSADARWIAGMDDYLVSVFDRATGEACEAEELEIADGNLPWFAPSAPLLAISGSNQGQGSIGLFRIDEAGIITTLYEAGPGWPGDNVFHSLAFSPDSHWVASISTYEDPNPWEFTLALYDVEDGSLEWANSVNGERVGAEPWSNFYGERVTPTELVFRGDVEILYGAPEGRILGFSRATGEMIRNVSLPKEASTSRRRYAKDILSIALQADGTKVWAVLQDGKFCSIPLEPLPESAVAPAKEELPRIPASRKIKRNKVTRMALSPNGEQAFVQLEEGWTPDDKVQAAEGLVQILDCRTGEKILGFPDLEDAHQFYNVVYSPDGGMIALNGYRQIELYDARSGAKRGSLPIHQQYRKHPVQGNDNLFSLFAFAPDGRHFLTSGAGGTACLWEIESGHKTFEVGVNVRTAAFSQAGTQLVTVSKQLDIVLWDASTGESLRELGKPQYDETDVAVTFRDQDRRILVLDLYAGQARIWDIKTNSMVGEFDVPIPHMDVAAFSPDGRLLVTGGREPVVWDCETGRPCCSLRGHHHLIDSISFCATRTTIATLNLYSAQLWELDALPLSAE